MDDNFAGREKDEGEKAFFRIRYLDMYFRYAKPFFRI